VLCAIALTGLCLLASPDANAATDRTLNGLIGKRVPGAPRSWFPIIRTSLSSREEHVYYLPKTLEDVLITGERDPAFPSVQFYAFRTAETARQFYRQPGTNLAPFIASMRPLAGQNPVPGSRWIDLQQCIYVSGPNPHDAPRGAPASMMSPSGTCRIGTPMSIGFASISIHRTVVIVVNDPDPEISTTPIPHDISAFPALVVLTEAKLALNSTGLLVSHHD
jgi:hypothetical protein